MLKQVLFEIRGGDEAIGHPFCPNIGGGVNYPPSPRDLRHWLKHTFARWQNDILLLT
jgi:hypothetical protein